jgi:hypothetical protein
VIADKTEEADALSPNLKDYFRHGGKLLIYHGWDDQTGAARNTINYDRSVVAAIGGAAETAKSMRLFMAHQARLEKAGGYFYFWTGDAAVHFKAGTATAHTSIL